MDNLLKPGLQAIETGYQRLENGMLMVSVLNKMVGCKFRMLDWWVRNYTAEDYKRWHPEHVSAEFGGPYRILSEKIGSGPLIRAKFEVLDPADYFDTAAFGASGAAGAIIAHGGPVDGTTWSGLSVYVVRDTFYGCEMRNRYFTGDISPANGTAKPEEQKKPISENTIRTLAHMLEEWANLSAFLPELYAQRQKSVK